MNSHANAVKIGQQIVKGLVVELENVGPQETVIDTRATCRYALRGAAQRMLQNLWHDFYHPSVRARYDYRFDSYLKAIGWPD